MKSVNIKANLIMFGVVLVLLASASVSFAAAGDSARINLVLLRTDPSPVVAGDYFDMVLQLENTGSLDAKNVNVELIPQYPFSIDPQEEAEINYGTVMPYMPIEIKYKVRVDANAVDGTNNIAVAYTLGDDMKVTKDIGIDVEHKSIEFAVGSLLSEPSKLVSDTEDAKITVEILNVGDADAKMVTSKLVLPSGFSPSTSYSDIYNLGTIGSDAGKDAVYYVDIGEDVEDGIYTAKIELKFKDDTGSKSEYKTTTLDLAMLVMGRPKFEIACVETIPESVAAGSEGNVIKLNIKNTGSKKAESVSLRVLKKADQPFGFDEKSDYIGTLDAGSEGEAVLRFGVDTSAASKKYLLELESRYVYEGTVFVEYFTVPVDVVKNEQGSQKYAVSAVVIVLLAVAAYFGRNYLNLNTKMISGETNAEKKRA